MKAKASSFTVLLLAFGLCANLVFSQAPQGFSYQAVIRNGSGAPIASQPIGLRITLENAAHVAYYSETQTATSNAQGVISVSIGGGTQVGIKTFASIPWENGDVFIKLEIDPTGGSSYTAMGEPTPLKSVPYALYAENTKEIVSNPNAAADDPIFEVKNKDGLVVFGVYQGGVRVYVEDTQIKGAKGGFAVGGLTNQAKAGQAEYFRITPDSARIWVKEVPAVKGAKGGFAVGGLTNQAKTVVSRNMLLIGPDSARIWVKDATKGAKGGFAVGGLTNQGKAETGNFLNLTPDNYLIGQDAGKLITSGVYNSFMGFEAGKWNKTGDNNVYLGYKTGSLNSSGLNNVFIGNNSGYNSNGGYSNVFIGHFAGYNSTSTTHSTFIGTDVAYNMNGDDNIVIGDQAGRNNYVANYETSGAVIIGVDAGRNITGGGNVIMGIGAGSKWGSTADRNNNVFIGQSAGGGGTNTLSDNNVCIGYNAGYEKTGSNKLYIANSETNNLIYGDFSAKTLQLNGNVGINNVPNSIYGLTIGNDGNDTYALVAYGPTFCSSGTWAGSDIRFKTNISTLNNGLEKVMKLRGVNFEWKTKEFPSYGFPDGQTIGVIAQEIEKVLPEIVTSGPDGYKSVAYDKLTVVLIEAIKEQQQKIQLLEERAKEVDALKAELEAIKALLKSKEEISSDKHTATLRRLCVFVLVKILDESLKT